MFFSPEDLCIIKNGPSERRRFIDSELCQLDKVYLHDLSDYNKTVLQRNKLLKELHFHPDYREVLEILDLQLVKYGREIIRRRQAFIGELNEIMGEIHGRLSGGQEHMVLEYEANVTEQNFAGMLEQNLDRDIRQKTTTTGPHRDVFSIYGK